MYSNGYPRFYCCHVDVTQTKVNLPENHASAMQAKRWHWPPAKMVLDIEFYVEQRVKIPQAPGKVMSKAHFKAPSQLRGQSEMG